MNGDGFPDLVVGESSNFVVLLGSGDGGFQLANTTHIPSSSNGIAVGDLNGDGKIDVVFTNSVQPYIYAYLGNGDGTFQPRMKSDIDGSRTHPALVDMSADGLPDLVAIETLFPTTLDVYMNKGDGTFDRFPTRELASSASAWKFALCRTLAGSVTSAGTLLMVRTTISGWCARELISPSRIRIAHERLRTV